MWARIKQKIENKFLVLNFIYLFLHCGKIGFLYFLLFVPEFQFDF